MPSTISLLAALVSVALSGNPAQADDVNQNNARDLAEAKKAIACFGGVVDDDDYDEYRDWHIRTIHFENTHLTDAQLLSLVPDLITIYRLSQPKRCFNDLDLTFTQVTGKGFTALAQIPNLTHLDLTSTLLCDEGLRELQQLPALRVLYLDYAHISLDALEDLLNVTDCRLKTLSLQGVTFAKSNRQPLAVGERGSARRQQARLICKLSVLKHLEVLDLSELDLENADLKRLGECGAFPALKKLDLSHNAKLTNGCLASVTSLDKLDWLSFWGNRGIGDHKSEERIAGIIASTPAAPSVAQLAVLAGFSISAAQWDLGTLNKLGTRLLYLDLSGTSVTNAGLARLQLPNLRVLDISDTSTILDAKVLGIPARLPVVQRVLEALGAGATQRPTRFANVEELYADNTGISDAELFAIAQLRKLNELGLQKTMVTSKRIGQMLQSGLLARLTIYLDPTPADQWLKAVAANQVRPARISTAPSPRMTPTRPRPRSGP